MAKAKKQQRTFPPTPPNRQVSVLDDPPRNNVLLLSCMDQRLLDETVRFMNKLNLHNRYDQIALAGGAMGVHRLPENPCDQTATWWALFTAHLSTAIDKLGRPIKDVFLLDHLDCGAYKELHPIDKIKREYSKATLSHMRELHADELAALAKRVHHFCESQYKATKDQAWEHIRVSCFIMDLCGQVVQIEK
jgi:carbonic anhydrase